MGLFGFIRRLFGSPASAEAEPAATSALGMTELARRLGLDADQLQAVVPAYRTFTVPKRSGGTRSIDAPLDAFKLFQRRLHKRVLARLPVHPAATAFQPGLSIVHHAMRHTLRQVVLRMDIRDFFPSITADRVRQYFQALGWRGQALKLLTNWTTYQDHLPQGAPTSPKLANALCFRMDTRISKAITETYTFNPKTLETIKSQAAHVAYSRYADDLTFSFDIDSHDQVNRTIYMVKQIVEEEGFHIHTRKKLRIMRPHDRQFVTGLVVNAGVNLPRSRRRQLRAVEHHLATGKSATMTRAQLAGWRALEQMVLMQSSSLPEDEIRDSSSV